MVRMEYHIYDVVVPILLTVLLLVLVFTIAVCKYKKCMNMGKDVALRRHRQLWMTCGSLSSEFPSRSTTEQSLYYYTKDDSDLHPTFVTDACVQTMEQDILNSNGQFAVCQGIVSHNENQVLSPKSDSLVSPSVEMNSLTQVDSLNLERLYTEDKTKSMSPSLLPWMSPTALNTELDTLNKHSTPIYTRSPLQQHKCTSFCDQNQSKCIPQCYPTRKMMPVRADKKEIKPTKKCFSKYFPARTKADILSPICDEDDLVDNMFHFSERDTRLEVDSIVPDNVFDDDKKYKDDEVDNVKLLDKSVHKDNDSFTTAEHCDTLLPSHKSTEYLLFDNC